uniref:Zinc finger protein with KRAB and SCAN domains 7-like isoform X2 n=1 Tax=Petromyzon marinus TaxID=7757 RepID=A0AAJ7T2G9_PETMA|nr:zinc finger protein with KRAB and SCAN domains 7-like isoform X2 [Petromyzon marinus]
MACAVASVPAIASILEPSEDFPAWLETQGVNAEVARAMDSELGIRDYGVLRACVGDGLVRAELLAAARDRLPFGFYAVLRQVVKTLQGTEPHDGAGTPRWDDDAAASSPGDVTLGGLVEVLLALLSGLSRELLLSMRRLGGGSGGDGGGGGGCGDGSGNGGDGRVFSGDSPPDPEGLASDSRVADEEEGTASVKNEYSGYDATTVFANAEHRSPTQMEDYDEHCYNHLSEEPRQNPTTAVDGNSPNGMAHNIKLETFEGEESRAALGGEGSGRLCWEETEAHHSVAAGTAANSGSQLADATTVFANAEHRSPTQMEDYEEPRQTPTTAVDGNSSNGVPHNIKLETFEGEESRAALGGEGSSHLRWEETEAHHSVAAGTAANSGSQLAGKLLDKTPLDYVKDDRHTPAESLVPHPNQFDRQWRQQQQEPQHQVMGEDRVSTDCAATSTTANPRLPASWRAAVNTAAARRRSREPGDGIIGIGRGVGIGGVGAGRGGERRFECPQCGRHLSRYEALVFHMRTHTGEQPFSCDVCGRAFSLHSNLKVHRRTHTGERPHRCDVCGRRFAYRSSWKRHQRTHDNI